MSRKRINYSIKIIIKKVAYYFLLGILTYSTFSFSSKHSEKLNEVRTHLFSNFSFVFKLFSLPFLPIQAMQNNEQTEAKVEALKKLFWEVNVQREELVLSSLKTFKKSIFELNLQQFNLIFITPSYYSSSGFLTDVIFNSNSLTEEEIETVKPNMAVISERGLYGRVAAISGKKFIIISIYSILSRIPVYTKTSKVYGMASGAGSDIYFTYPSDETAKLIEGEDVFTSGENDLIIAEIPFGKVQQVNGKFVIIPFSKTRPSILGIINKAA
jgi:cell shape-determining protein MreC